MSFGTYGSVGADALAKSQLVMNISQKNRKDTALDGSVTATFDVARWFAMDIGYRLRAIMTDYKITSKDGAILDVGSYTGHEVFATAILRY